ARLPLAALDPLPLRKSLGGVGYLAAREHVRVPADHLLVEPGEEIGHGELPRLARELGVEHHLEQEIAQLLLDVVARPPVEGLQGLVRLLDEIGLERLARLLPVPGAATLR